MKYFTQKPARLLEFGVFQDPEAGSQNPAWMLYKTRAIVLRKRELGEADLNLTLLSPERGKFNAVARGSRKPTARMMGRLEPMMELDVMLATARTLDVLTEVRVLRDRHGLQDSLMRLACGSYLLEIFDCLLEPGADAPPLYELLSAALDLLETADHPQQADMLLRWCEIRLIGLLGYEPETGACVQCSRQQPGGASWSFSIHLGGLLCAPCLRADAEAVPISAGTIGLYAQLQRCDPVMVRRLRADARVERQLESLMRQHLAYRWPHRLKSLAFLEQVRSLEPASWRK